MAGDTSSMIQPSEVPPSARVLTTLATVAIAVHPVDITNVQEDQNEIYNTLERPLDVRAGGSSNIAVPTTEPFAGWSIGYTTDWGVITGFEVNTFIGIEGTITKTFSATDSYALWSTFSRSSADAAPAKDSSASDGVMSSSTIKILTSVITRTTAAKSSTVTTVVTSTNPGSVVTTSASKAILPSVTITITAVPSYLTHPKSNPDLAWVGKVAGISVGSFFTVAIVLSLIFCYLKRRQRVQVEAKKTADLRREEFTGNEEGSKMVAQIQGEHSGGNWLRSPPPSFEIAMLGSKSLGATQRRNGDGQPRQQDNIIESKSLRRENYPAEMPGEGIIEIG